MTNLFSSLCVSRWNQQRWYCLPSSARLQRVAFATTATADGDSDADDASDASDAADDDASSDADAIDASAMATASSSSSILVKEEEERRMIEKKKKTRNRFPPKCATFTVTLSISIQLQVLLKLHFSVDDMCQLSFLSCEALNDLHSSSNLREEGKRKGKGKRLLSLRFGFHPLENYLLDIE